MTKKVVKQKQKQKQTQKVIVNISHPVPKKRGYKRRIDTSPKEQPRQFLPMMPSFNINQPQATSDLAKLVGMLIPKLQTQSTLGSAIPVKSNIKEPVKDEGIAGLTKLYESIDSLLPEALNAKVEEATPKRTFEKPKFANPYYDQETEAEGVPLVEAQVKTKRKYTKSGKYSKKTNPIVEEQQTIPEE